MNWNETDINHKLERITLWFNVNHLFINYSKTKAMLFYNKNKIINEIEIKLDNNVIEYVDHFNFLGLTIHKNLYWNEHINIICKKLSRNIGILNSIFDIIPIKVLYMLYHAFVMPILTYGITSWGQTTQTNKNRIDTILRRFNRILYYKNSNVNTEINKLMNINRIYEYKTCLIMYNSIKNSMFPGVIQIKKFDHQYLTRNHDNLIPIFARTNIQHNGINHIGPVLWNKLPNELKNINSKRLFSKSLKKYLTKP